jgi:glycosyltransferase involved in cell wall biosynthesis
MARQRYNPAALRDPKVSVVIPVYNEKSTVDEILRRVLDTDVRKEVIVVDDCSTDGTRQILETMAARQTLSLSDEAGRERSTSAATEREY